MTGGVLFDGHLDLAWNAQLGRDLTLDLVALRAQDPVAGQTAGVSFPELRRAGVAACFGTLFACPASDDYPQGYEQDGRDDWKGARRQALWQLDQYRRWQDDGLVRLLTTAGEVSAHLRDWDAGAPGPLGVVLLMEGADPMRSADDLDFWVRAGVRLVGPAWGRTRYAGGTDAPGPLTERGVELLTAMRESGVTLDVSHLDDAAWEEALRLQPKVVATHANSRAFVPGNRHLSDGMAGAVVERGGVIGLVALSTFIRAGWDEGDARVELREWAAHARHYGETFGWAHVGLGTDLDGGFGVEKAPAGVDRYLDVERLASFLPPEAWDGVRGGNWARWAGEHL
ncbi:dipeptidase [Deinococcus aquiradiocola]|uniref:Peptidase n=1 Tax=Deinococcus aquiradiocola TaxID=393059 RepID=A0A917P742_9DEIO|nr:membrane dipeptidase [Deinococcus aquiradiocola]GGJ64531.1 peptidase [Deinococcus aquiradiocola]